MDQSRDYQSAREYTQDLIDHIAGGFVQTSIGDIDACLSGIDQPDLRVQFQLLRGQFDGLKASATAFLSELVGCQEGKPMPAPEVVKLVKRKHPRTLAEAERMFPGQEWAKDLMRTLEEFEREQLAMRMRKVDQS